VGHVRDVDAHFEVAAVEVPHAQGIVEILGVFGVDGERGHVPHVAAALDLFGIELLGDGLCLIFHILREMVGQAELQQDGVHFRLVDARCAQHFDHLGDGRVVGRGPILEPDGDLDVRRGIVQEAGRNEEVAVQALVGGDAEGVILHGLQHDHVQLAGPLHHPGDVRHLAPATVHPADFHGVPPEGGSRVALGQHDVLGFAGNAHEPLAILGDLNRAGDHVAVLALSPLLPALATASVSPSTIRAGLFGEHESALADLHEHTLASLLAHEHMQHLPDVRVGDAHGAGHLSGVQRPTRKLPENLHDVAEVAAGSAQPLATTAQPVVANPAAARLLLPSSFAFAGHGPD